MTPTDEVKGYIFTDFVAALSRMRCLDELQPRLSPRCQQLIRQPPIRTDWVDAALMQEILDGLFALKGDAGVRAFGRQVTRDGVGVLEPIVQGIFRLFGTSPATLLSRMNLLNRGVMRNSSSEYVFTSTSERSGVMEYILKNQPNTPRSTFVLLEGVLEQIVGLCRKKGEVSAAEIISDQKDGKARYQVSW
jgi:hypothetical protein